MGLFDKFKNINVETEEEKKKRIAQETIDTYLSQFKDVDGYYANLNKASRDIIHDMISHEDEEKVLKVLEVAEDVNKEDKYGYTYLTVACSEHKIQVIEKLLSMGANPNQGDSPLLDALGGNNKNNPKILELFIKYGVDLKKEINGATLEDTIRSFEEAALNEILDNNK